ncbi:MAG: hypothetical protein JNL70_17555 [Saprospiraceae bacterium]|nr:hypothetical protein [Saprospiraceae bacterium]
MRKRIIVMTLLIVSLIGQSQAQDTTQTLLKLIKPQTLGLYIAPEMGYGQVRGSLTNIGGMSGMLIVNKKWAIGLTSQMVTSRNFVPSAISPNYMRAAWMGGKIEYTLKPDKLMHVSFPLMVGMGRASADSLTYKWGRRDDWYDVRNANSSRFVVVQPGINVEMNLIRFAKLYVGASYRLSFLTDDATTLLPANSLQGYDIHAGLRLGLFGVNIKRKQATETKSE